MTKEYQPVVLSKRIHERLRREAFQRHASMKATVEAALIAHYHWKLEKEEEDAKENLPNQRPSL